MDDAASTGRCSAPHSTLRHLSVSQRIQQMTQRTSKAAVVLEEIVRALGTFDQVEVQDKAVVVCHTLATAAYRRWSATVS